MTRLKLPPFIVTLGTLSIFFSLNAVVSKSETIRGSDMPDIMTWTGTTIRLGSLRLTYGSIIMLLLFAVFFYALTRTAWGKHVYATGDDVEAARLAGIRTDRVLLSVYTVAGLLYAIGAWILIGRLAAASPNVGTEYNLDSITAVVLGGTSLFGGRGGVLGTLVGALIVGVFRNGLQLAGVAGGLAGHGDRPARARRRLDRPVDQEGEGMTATETSRSPQPARRAPARRC